MSSCPKCHAVAWSGHTCSAYEIRDDARDVEIEVYSISVRDALETYVRCRDENDACFTSGLELEARPKGGVWRRYEITGELIAQYNAKVIE